MPAYPPPYPHDPIREIADGVFLAHGSVRMNPLVRICRNMVIVRQDGELVLVNPVRLNDTELARLEALGRVRALVRLGSMHGSDDAFYRDRYDCELWREDGPSNFPEPAADRTLAEEASLPLQDASLFCFRGVRQPESALLLAPQRLLLTCDALQHYGDYSQCSFAARLLMPLIGFPRRTIVGPFWLKLATPAGGNLRPEFERLLTLEFDALLAAHGTFLARDARAAVQRAVDAAL